MSNEGLAVALAEFLERNEEALPSLRSLHRPDRKGCCRVCRSGGDSTGHMKWPCTMAVLLSQAKAPLRLVRQPE